MKNSREILSENLQRLMKSKGVDQRMLANYLGVSEMSVSNWATGSKYPRINNIQMIADYFGVMKSDLIEDKSKSDESLYLSNSQYTYYPTSISAGLPLTVDGTDATTISISDEVMGKYKNDKTVFFARINGDSMNNIMDDGTLIAIKPTPIETLQNGDIVVFSNEHEYSVKHIYKTPQAIIFKPNSTNDCHHEQHFSYDDEIVIHGKVITYIINLD